MRNLLCLFCSYSFFPQHYLLYFITLVILIIKGGSKNQPNPSNLWFKQYFEFLFFRITVNSNFQAIFKIPVSDLRLWLLAQLTSVLPNFSLSNLTVELIFKLFSKFLFPIYDGLWVQLTSVLLALCTVFSRIFQWHTWLKLLSKF